MKTTAIQRARVYAHDIGVCKSDDPKHWNDVIRAYAAGHNRAHQIITEEIALQAAQWIQQNFLAFVSVCDGELDCTLTAEDILKALKQF